MNEKLSYYIIIILIVIQICSMIRVSNNNFKKSDIDFFQQAGRRNIDGALEFLYYGTSLVHTTNY